MKALIKISATAAFLISLLTFCAIATLRLPVTSCIDDDSSGAPLKAAPLLHSRPSDTSLIFYTRVAAW